MDKQSRRDLIAARHRSLVRSALREARREVFTSSIYGTLLDEVLEEHEHTGEVEASGMQLRTMPRAGDVS